MTREQHIEAAITELTRAKVTIADDPGFARSRLTDARMHIAAVVAELSQPSVHHAALSLEREVA